MNDLTKESIKIALCNALADGKNLMQKEVAENFGTDSCSISNVKNPTGWKRVPQTLWDDLNEWRTLGVKLRGFVPSRLLQTSGPEVAPEPAQEPSIYDKLEAQNKRAKEKKEAKVKPEPKPEQQPAPKEEPEPKEQSVSKGAKKFLNKLGETERELEFERQIVEAHIKDLDKEISFGETEDTNKLKEKRKKRKADPKHEWKKAESKESPVLEGKKPQEPKEEPQLDKEFLEAIEELNKGIIIPIGIHKYTPEEPVISKKFGIEVEVRMRIKEGN